jgi:hypothetical protein
MIISFFFPTHQHGYEYERQINTFLFMSVIFMLIQIRFDIDINSDELLKTIWKHKKKKKS